MPIFKSFYSQNNLSESFGHAYDIMTLVDGANSITYNRQRSSDFTDRLNMEYRNGPLYLSMNPNFAWHRYTSVRDKNTEHQSAKAANTTMPHTHFAC